MQYFNFTRLVEKYMNEFTLLVPTVGEYNDSGDWVDGEATKKVMRGAIISFKESKVFRSEGTLTANDKRLFTLEPLEKALIGSEIIYGNNKYKIDSETENAEFTGVYSYLLKFVSAFGGVEP